MTLIKLPKLKKMPQHTSVTANVPAAPVLVLSWLSRGMPLVSKHRLCYLQRCGHLRLSVACFAGSRPFWGTAASSVFSLGSQGWHRSADHSKAALLLGLGDIGQYV